MIPRPASAPCAQTTIDPAASISVIFLLKSLLVPPSRIHPHHIDLICVFMDPKNVDARFEALPSEILQCFILPYLPQTSLLACSFVSRYFSQNILASGLFKAAETNRQQRSRLKQLYQLGSLPLLKWFNTYLRYPILFSRNKAECLIVAAEGKKIQKLRADLE